MNDDRFASYLRSRAATVEVPLTDVAVIAERARNRRHRRHVRAARVAGAVVVLAATATAVAASSDGRTPVASTPLGAQTSPLDWQVVQPEVGLGYARTAVGADAVYSLSTAPGPMPEAGFVRNDTLYRSTDGAEWEALDLPDDLYASALGLDGGRLYAVGTGPVGDDERIPLRLGWSDDGGASWATEAVDLGVGELQDRYPGEVSVGAPTIATRGGTTVIATSISASIDVAGRAPDLDLEHGGGFVTTPDGIDVYSAEPVACDRGDPCAGPEVIEHRTWEDLGVPAELAALTTPDLVVVASTDGSPFEPVTLPVVDGYGTELVVTDAGFTLLVQQLSPAPHQQTVSSVAVLTSADGRTWEQRPPVAGYLESTGRMPGGVGIATRDDRALALVTILGDDGSRRTVDPLAEVSLEILEQQPFTSTFGFGPLGWATVATTSESGDRVLVHSDPSGSILSTVALPPELHDGMESGVIVTADVIAVRFTEAGDGDPGTVPVQRLYVGTPAGP